MGQDLQFPQPHTMDLPCFFFLTMFTMIAATIAISTAQMMIVQIFSDNHVIRSTPKLDQQIKCHFHCRGGS